MRSLVLSLIFMSTAPGFAQEQIARISGIQIQADSMDRDTVNETVTLEGNIQLIYKDQHLKADRARVNLRSKTMDAIGNVLVVTPQATIGGDRIMLDYESSTGVIINGYVQSGNVLFEGSLINKISDTEYIANDAKYTTCTTCPEAWSFSGSRIRAELGGYAYIKSSVMRAGGLPVFWIPYLIVPLKSDRQSGLLTPGLEVSNTSGLTLAQSYFWAIDRSRDATISVKNYELRGLKGLLNYRYMLSEHSYGELDAGSLTDRVFGQDPRLNGFRRIGTSGDPVDRWFLKYNHYFDLPEGYIHRAQFNNASDLQYPKDFSEETLNHGDTAMESRMSVTKNTLDQHFSVDTSYYRNLLQSDPLSGNDFAVHRLPEVKYAQTLTKVGSSDFLFAFDLNYANFTRTSFAYDELNAPYDPNGPNNRHLQTTGPHPDCSTPDWEKNPACSLDRDGSYDSSRDLIRSGQRLDFKPTLYRPIKFENLELLPQISYRETQYTFPVGDQSRNVRRYLRAEMSAKTTFSRVFGEMKSLQGHRIKHEVQPELTFTTIPWIDHPPHPFFGSLQQTEIPFFNQESLSDSDLNGPFGVQFDYNDRVYDRKLATFGITNKLTEKRWSNGTPEYRQFLTWKLAQSYDLYQQEKAEDPQPYSDLISDLKVYLDRIQIYQRANYFPYQQVTNTSTRVRLTSLLGDFIQLEHLLVYNISPGQDVDIKARTEDYTWSLKKSLSWFDIIGKITTDANPKDKADWLKSWGYGAQLKLPGDCLYFSLIHYQVTGGDTNFRLGFNFVWDGQQRPTLPETILSAFGF